MQKEKVAGKRAGIGNNAYLFHRQTLSLAIQAESREGQDYIDTALGARQPLNAGVPLYRSDDLLHWIGIVAYL